MRIKTEESGSVVIITLEGDMIGGPDAARLADQFRVLIDQGKKRIIVNMSQVSYINSTGLGILIGGLTTVRNKGGELKLLKLEKKLRELLRITKLDCVFEIFENEEEAIASFA
ncbi:MAG TPA: anti-sigma factor antagonist [bacterium]|nr:anti-sigma factor antagonist [bacterium]